MTSYRPLRWFAPIYEGHRQFWLYALFGLGTILLSINLYLILTEKMGTVSYTHLTLPTKLEV